MARAEVWGRVSSFLRERLDVRWGAKKQNDTLSRDYNRPNPLFCGPSGASFPVCLYICFCATRLLREDRPSSYLLPSPSSHESSSRSARLRVSPRTHTCRTRSAHAYAKSALTYTESAIFTFLRGRSEYISSGNTIISPYRGKILVASVDLLAEIRAVTADSYET